MLSSPPSSIAAYLTTYKMTNAKEPLIVERHSFPMAAEHILQKFRLFLLQREAHWPFLAEDKELNITVPPVATKNGSKKGRARTKENQANGTTFRLANGTNALQSKVFLILCGYKASE